MILRRVLTGVALAVFAAAPAGAATAKFATPVTLAVPGGESRDIGVQPTPDGGGVISIASARGENSSTLYVARLRPDGRLSRVTRTRFDGLVSGASPPTNATFPEVALGRDAVLTTYVRVRSDDDPTSLTAYRIDARGRIVGRKVLTRTNGGYADLDANARGDAVIRWVAGGIDPPPTEAAVMRNGGRFRELPRPPVLPPYGSDASLRIAPTGELLAVYRDNGRGRFGFSRQTSGGDWQVPRLVYDEPDTPLADWGVLVGPRATTLAFWRPADTTASNTPPPPKPAVMTWSSRGGPFGPVLGLPEADDADELDLAVTPDGRFALARVDDGRVSALSSRGPGRPFSRLWETPALPGLTSPVIEWLSDGSAIIAWTSRDNDNDTLRAVVVDPRGRVGRAQTVASESGGPARFFSAPFILATTRGGAALSWTDDSRRADGDRVWRAALLRR